MAPPEGLPHEKWRRIFHFPSIHRLAPYIDIYPYHCLMVYNMVYIIVSLS